MEMMPCTALIAALTIGWIALNTFWKTSRMLWIIGISIEMIHSTTGIAAVIIPVIIWATIVIIGAKKAKTCPIRSPTCFTIGMRAFMTRSITGCTAPITDWISPQTALPISVRALRNTSDCDQRAMIAVIANPIGPASLPNTELRPFTAPPAPPVAGIIFFTQPTSLLMFVIAPPINVNAAPKIFRAGPALTATAIILPILSWIPSRNPTIGESSSILNARRSSPEKSPCAMILNKPTIASRIFKIFPTIGESSSQSNASRSWEVKLPFRISSPSA